MSSPSNVLYSEQEGYTLEKTLRSDPHVRPVADFLGKNSKPATEPKIHVEEDYKLPHIPIVLDSSPKNRKTRGQITYELVNSMVRQDTRVPAIVFVDGEGAIAALASRNKLLAEWPADGSDDAESDKIWTEIVNRCVLLNAKTTILAIDGISKKVGLYRLTEPLEQQHLGNAIVLEQDADSGLIRVWESVDHYEKIMMCPIGTQTDASRAARDILRFLSNANVLPETVVDEDSLNLHCGLVDKLNEIDQDVYRDDSQYFIAMTQRQPSDDTFAVRSEMDVGEQEEFGISWREFVKGTNYKRTVSAAVIDYTTGTGSLLSWDILRCESVDSNGCEHIILDAYCPGEEHEDDFIVDLKSDDPTSVVRRQLSDEWIRQHIGEHLRFAEQFKCQICFQFTDEFGGLNCPCKYTYFCLNCLGQEMDVSGGGLICPACRWEVSDFPGVDLEKREMMISYYGPMFCCLWAEL